MITKITLDKYQILVIIALLIVIAESMYNDFISLKIKVKYHVFCSLSGIMINDKLLLINSLFKGKKYPINI